MKPVSISEIKKDLETRQSNELLGYCLRLARFKKENKELLAFLLFESDNLSDYTENVKQQIEQQFEEMNKSNIYFIKKSVRKILRMINKHIRFSLPKQSEAELIIHFCNCMRRYSIPLKKSRQLMNLYESQLKKIDAALSTLHPDLQYDLKKQLLP
jgi:DNA-binding transcriptional MerR regulator